MSTLSDITFLYGNGIFKLKTFNVGGVSWFEGVSVAMLFGFKNVDAVLNEEAEAGNCSAFSIDSDNRPILYFVNEDGVMSLLRNTELRHDKIFIDWLKTCFLTALTTSECSRGFLFKMFEYLTEYTVVENSARDDEVERLKFTVQVFESHLKCQEDEIKRLRAGQLVDSESYKKVEMFIQTAVVPGGKQDFFKLKDLWIKYKSVDAKCRWGEFKPLAIAFFSQINATFRKRHRSCLYCVLNYKLK